MLETLEPLPGDRKCFRMINGVLAERTVADIVPILQTNQDGLKKTLEELVKQYKTRQDEMEKWKVCSVVGREKSGADICYRRRTISRLFSSRGSSGRPIVGGAVLEDLEGICMTSEHEMKMSQKEVVGHHRKKSRHRGHNMLRPRSWIALFLTTFPLRLPCQYHIECEKVGLR